MVDFVYVGGLATDVGSHPPIIEFYVEMERWYEDSNKDKIGYMCLNEK